MARSISKTVLSRGLTVSSEEVDSFPFDHTDILIAQAMLSGAQTPGAISDETELTATAVRHRLLDPVRCAWISKELRKSVETRLGNVIAAVYNRAVSTGDPRAAKMLLELYKQFESTPQKHLHVHTNLTGLTDEQLDKMIAQKQRQLNIKDVEFTEKNE